MSKLATKYIIWNSILALNPVFWQKMAGCRSKIIITSGFGFYKNLQKK
jgi:hypothetical protein